MEAYSTPWPAAGGQGAVAAGRGRGRLEWGTIAQGAEIALSGHDRADAAGDMVVLTPGIGRRGGRRAGDGLGRYVVLAGFCGSWGSGGAVGEFWAV